jgi:hypothetical protein
VEIPGATVEQPQAERPRASVVALVLANVMPLYGVLFLHWTVFPLILFFWAENVVIGVFNVLRMIASKPSDAMNWLAKFFIIPFFTVHYGMFTFVHGVFVVGFFGGFFRGGASAPTAGAVWQVVLDNQLHYALAALVVSHGVSFFANYIGRGEYRTASLQQLMGAPYGRVVVLHLAVLFGGFLVMATNSAVAALVLLIALKVGLDIVMHLREHARLARRTDTK